MRVSVVSLELVICQVSLVSMELVLKLVNKILLVSSLHSSRARI